MDESMISANIRDLRDIREGDTRFAGSKGALLGELENAGFPISPGFVVGAPAYHAFLEGSGLRAGIAGRLGELDVSDSAALTSASVHIRGAVNNAEMPEDIRAEIIAAYGELGSSSVAVRASTTSENTSASSSAGATEAELRVEGEAALVKAVEHCWSSLFTPQNIFYSARHGRSAVSADIGVIVQRQIDAHKAGMLLTVDPVTGMTDRVVIEASLGLGEAIAGGSVSPDRFVVEKETQVLLTRQVRHKELVIEREPGDGNRIRHLRKEDQDAPVLTDLQVQLLFEIGLRAEEHFGGPQSMEWVIDPDDVTWVLQTRPAPVPDRPPERRPRDGADGPHVLRGECAMPGVVSGRARVVASAEDASRFTTDEILVTRDIAPEWTPLMQRASAVVTDFGGVTSHAATVARELEIPCVVGTGGATRQLKTGDMVMVDATGGMVVPA